MPVINVDGVDYDLDSLSDSTRQIVQSIQFIDGEMKRLIAQNAVLKTARVAYSNSLKQALNTETRPFDGDTIKFS